MGSVLVVKTLRSLTAINMKYHQACIVSYQNILDADTMSRISYYIILQYTKQVLKY
jgi:hypothetical protein